jgi:hypothetical protein
MKKSNRNIIAPAVSLWFTCFLLAACAKQDGRVSKKDADQSNGKNGKPVTTVESTNPDANGFLSEHSRFIIPAVPGRIYEISDLNGDAIQDSVFLVKVVSVPESSEKLRLVNIFEEPALRSDSSFALGISLGSPRSGPIPNHYLIYGSDFFSSPIWTNGKPWELIRVVRVPDSRADTGLAGIPGRKGDLIGLYSESSSEFFLYFDGAGFKAHWPGDAP